MAATVDVQIPPVLIPVFTGEADVRGAYGGRGSGKTMAATQTDRKVGIKFTAAAATKAAGQVGLTLLYRAV